MVLANISKKMLVLFLTPDLKVHLSESFKYESTKIKKKMWGNTVCQHNDYKVVVNGEKIKPNTDKKNRTLTGNPTEMISSSRYEGAASATLSRQQKSGRYYRKTSERVKVKFNLGSTCALVWETGPQVKCVWIKSIHFFPSTQ